jgi:hypothetical protein
MRTKEVECEGQKYLFGKLTSGQVDELIFAIGEMRKEEGKIIASVTGGKRMLRTQICPVIAAAFNNAIAGDGKWFFDGWDRPADLKPEATWYSAKDVFGTLDFSDTIRVYNEITRFSALTSEVKKAAPSGEGEAVDTTATS